jgi:hypothetical protein
VGKNVYYTTRGLCHMVLALKPFGCMPSSQSDGVQSAVVNRFPEMIFLPVETSGEGEINAHSRVQMALGEARVKARAEFDAALASTGKSLVEIRGLCCPASATAQSVLSHSAPPRHCRHSRQLRLCMSAISSMGAPRWLGCPESVEPTMPDQTQPMRIGPSGGILSWWVWTWVPQRSRRWWSPGEGGRVLWRDYRRHDTRQAEMLRDFLLRMESEAGIAPGNCRIFITGSGGHALAAPIGARFVQEVNAVALAVEKLHPEAHSVIELGGQDAKIILFKTESRQRTAQQDCFHERQVRGRHRRGHRQDSGQAEDSRDQLPHLAYRGVRIHPVAGKCGVFAETDINGLQKQGLPPDELMASLFDAIVLQNLTVLTRAAIRFCRMFCCWAGPMPFCAECARPGNTIFPCSGRSVASNLPPGLTAEDLIQTPPDALYFAALGAVEFGIGEAEENGALPGLRGAGARFSMQERSSGELAASPGCALPRRSCRRSKNATRLRRSFPLPFKRGNGSRPSSVSMAVRLLPKPCCCLQRRSAGKAYRISEGNPDCRLH